MVVSQVPSRMISMEFSTAEIYGTYYEVMRYQIYDIANT